MINMATPTKFPTPLAFSKPIEANRAVNLGMGIDPIGESELEELFEVTIGETRWGIGELSTATVEAATTVDGAGDAEVD